MTARVIVKKDTRQSVISMRGPVRVVVGSQGAAGANGTNGVNGASRCVTVDVIANGNVTIASGLENGDTVNGITLVTGQTVFLPFQTSPAQNGIYVVPASGAAARHTDFDAAADFPGAIVSVMNRSGMKFAGTQWVCWTAPGFTLGSGAIQFSRLIQHLECEPNPFPAVGRRPTLWQNFNLCPWLDPNWSFARSSIGTRWNEKGLIETVAAGVPRFNVDPVTGKRRLLIEGARTNLLVRSEEFDNASWTKTRASVTANAIASPFGTVTADKLVEDNSASTTHLVTQGASLTANTVYTLSVYAKAAERTAIRLQTSSAGNWAAAVSTDFDLSAGTVISGTGTIRALPNGWYRCSITATFGASNNTGGLNVFLYNGSTSYSGDNTSGVYLWGAQAEAGAWPSSYIPTVASQVTRAQDTLSRTDPDGLINLLEGALYVSGIAPYDDPTDTQARLIFLLDGNSTTDLHRLLLGSSGALVWQTLVANSALASLTLGTPGTSVFKAAGAYKLDDVAAQMNGGSVQTDTSASMPTVTHFRVGAASNDGLPFFGEIESIGYWPLRLSNTDIAALVA